MRRCDSFLSLRLARLVFPPESRREMILQQFQMLLLASKLKLLQRKLDTCVSTKLQQPRITIEPTHIALLTHELPHISLQKFPSINYDRIHSKIPRRHDYHPRYHARRPRC